MEEWQRRQREEKEKERRQKQASVEILSGYRGTVSEEEIKLKALRDEERQKKIEAEQRLREFKKLEEPMARHKTAAQQPGGNNIPPPVNAGGSEHADDPITFGSVSAIKANFSGSPQHSTSNYDPTRISQVPMEFDEPATATATTTTSTDNHEFHALAFAGQAEGMTATTLSPTPTTENVLTADTATAANGGDVAIPTAHQSTTVAQQQQHETPPPSSSRTTNDTETTTTTTLTTVYFKFGVISTNTHDPNLLAPYMAAVQSMLPPATAVRVHDVQADDSFVRPGGIQRVLVTVCV